MLGDVTGDHPHWCSPAHCSADRIPTAASGPAHRGTPTVVRDGRSRVTVWLEQPLGGPVRGVVVPSSAGLPGMAVALGVDRLREVWVALGELLAAAGAPTVR